MHPSASWSTLKQSRVNKDVLDAEKGNKYDIESYVSENHLNWCHYHGMLSAISVISTIAATLQSTKMDSDGMHDSKMS